MFLLAASQAESAQAAAAADPALSQAAAAAGAVGGIVAGVCGIIALVLHIIQSFKLSKVFGHGIGLGLVLLFLGPIGRLILGFGGSEYVGKQD